MTLFFRQPWIVPGLALAWLLSASWPAAAQVQTGEAGNDAPRARTFAPVPTPAAPEVLPEAAEPVGEDTDEEGEASDDAPAAPAAPAAVGSSFTTRTDARTFTLSVPAPRGQILDRRGYPLAQNKVAYFAAVNFPVMEGADDTAILRYAGERIVHVNRLLEKRYDLSSDVVLAHYRDRRWLPLTFSDPLPEEEAEKIRSNPVRGLMLQPVYLRHYPQGNSLPHVLGYVGKRPPRKLGPIEPNEPLWGEGMGVEGLEETYDTWLTGEPGRVNFVFEADGTKVREEITRRARPGNNLVTSIDAEMQRVAEDVLAENAKRGAFVVMDTRTGDVLVMASYPLFDPNDFIPSISQARFAALNNDPDKPLFPRAFRGAYPPASVFKIPVALAALEERVISESSSYSCPTSWMVGDVVMRNWNKDPEGPMNVVGAIARSCNTWFYEVGTRTGTDPVTLMGRRLGLGERTGIPLKSEVEGLMPTNRWWREKHGYLMSRGDLANICIGQGQVETSPLQVARLMAALGNRRAVLKARLVKQIQDYNNTVIQSLPVEEVRGLDIDPYYLNVVRQGMREVVNSGRGTGTRASHPKLVVVGKTGTGQWKPNLQQNVAWFAGFAPADSPVLAFAAIYEGDPGETVGGGRNAAPLVGEFLKRYLSNEERLDEILEEAGMVKALLAEVEPAVAQPVGSIFRDSDVEEQYQNTDDGVDPRQSVSGPGVAEDDGISRWFRRFRRR